MNNSQSEAITALREGTGHLYPGPYSTNIDRKEIVGIYYGDNKPDVFIELKEAFSILSQSALTRDEIIDAFKVLIICEGININGFLRAHDEKLKLDSLIENEDLESGLSF